MPSIYQRIVNSFRPYTPQAAPDVKALTVSGFGVGGQYFPSDLAPHYTTALTGQMVDSVGDPWGNSAVAACVQWMSRTLPQAPLSVFRAADGGKKAVPNHKLAKLWARPNPSYSGEVLTAGVLLSLACNGNAYVHIGKSVVGPAELWYLPHFAVKPLSSDGQTISHYEYKQGSKTVELPAEDVIHLRVGIDPRNLLLGLAPLAAAWREIGADNEALAFSAALLRNAGVPGVLISPADLSTVMEQEEAENIKAKWKEKVTGNNRGEPLVLPTPLSLEQFGFSPADLQIDKLHIIPETRVCALLGIPAMVVGLASGSEHRTYSNYEEARSAAWQDGLLPLARAIACQLDIQLLPFLGDESTESVEFDTSHVPALQDDMDKAAVRWSTLFDSGIARLGEARASFGLAATPDDDKFKHEIAAANAPEAPPPPVPTFRDGSATRL